jgi:hypothetical protein
VIWTTQGLGRREYLSGLRPFVKIGIYGEVIDPYAAHAMYCSVSSLVIYTFTLEVKVVN